MPGFLTQAGTEVVMRDNAYNVPLDKVIALHKRAADDITAQAAMNTRIAYVTATVSALLFILAGIVVAVVLRRMLILPLQRAGEITAAIGHGNRE